MDRLKRKFIFFAIALVVVFGYNTLFGGDKAINNEESQIQVITQTQIASETETTMAQTDAQSDSQTETQTETQSIDSPKTIKELVAAGILKEIKKDGDVIGWSTAGDLFYGMGSKHGNRVYHVFAHLEEDNSKPVHSVFLGDEASLLALLDEAWAKRDSAFTEAQSNGNRVYDIDMERVIGTDGEEEIRIVVRDGTNKLITAYPRD